MPICSDLKKNNPNITYKRISNSSVGKECTPLRCLLGCPYGYVKDSSGCDTCSCITPPESETQEPEQDWGCEPVECTDFCRYGFMRDPTTGRDVFIDLLWWSALICDLWRQPFGPMTFHTEIFLFILTMEWIPRGNFWLLSWIESFNLKFSVKTFNEGCPFGQFNTNFKKQSPQVEY